jgi:hypothetical protein
MAAGRSLDDDLQHMVEVAVDIAKEVNHCAPASPQFALQTDRAGAANSQPSRVGQSRLISTSSRLHAPRNTSSQPSDQASFVKQENSLPMTIAATHITLASFAEHGISREGCLGNLQARP